MAAAHTRSGTGGAGAASACQHSAGLGLVARLSAPVPAPQRLRPDRARDDGRLERNPRPAAAFAGTPRAGRRKRKGEDGSAVAGPCLRTVTTPAEESAGRGSARSG